jgi:hypothetical protein
LDWSETSDAIKFKKKKVRGVYKDWNCSIFVKRFTKVHQCRVVIWKDVVQFVLDLNTMGDDIGNKGNNALYEDNVLRALGEVFANNLESTSTESPSQFVGIQN